MKTASLLSTALLKRVLLICSIFFISLSTYAQTTIVNYNFDVNKIQDYPKFYTRAENGISCLLSSNFSYSQNLHDGTSGSISGPATGSYAFTANTVTSPNRIVAVSGSTTSYFNFQVSGSSLKAYSAFKFYFQAKRGSSGTSAINSVQYSIDGGAFTNLTRARAA